MLADDLLLGVALEPLRARIPVGDPSVRVQHVDRIIRYALYEEPESLLTRAKRVLACLSLAEVAGDLCKSHERAVCVPDRVDHDMRPHRSSVLPNTPSFLLE